MTPIILRRALARMASSKNRASFRIVLRHLGFATAADYVLVGTKLRRSYEDEIERAREEGFDSPRRIKEGAARGLDRLSRRSRTSSSQPFR
jgi:hypothetical protein